MGVLIAFFVITLFWPAGFDASLFYLRSPPTNSTVPIWAYLITYPLSFLGWPLSWQILVIATVLLSSIVYLMRGNQNWWIVVASTPMLYNAWWGQVEIFSVMGLLLGLLILQRKIHPVWLGVVWLALSIKIQATYGVLILISVWFWRKRGIRAMLPGILLMFTIIGLTFILWPGWLSRLLTVYRTDELGFSYAALWPYGLIAWPIAIFARNPGPDQRLRMFASASLLGSPYFTLHHCLLLMVLTDDHPAALLFSWLPAIMIFQTRDWAQYAWVIPIGVIARDLYLMYRKQFK
jgi:hypothetical protein